MGETKATKKDAPVKKADEAPKKEELATDVAKPSKKDEAAEVEVVQGNGFAFAEAPKDFEHTAYSEDDVRNIP